MTDLDAAINRALDEYAVMVRDARRYQCLRLRADIQGVFDAADAEAFDVSVDCLCVAWREDA